MSVKPGQLVEAAWFQRTIVAVILLAGVLAGLETSATMMQRHGTLLRALDTVVLAVFLAELGLKLAAHGRKPWLYFRNGWNRFDFIIVMLCCLPMDSSFAAVLRLARGLRVLRLVTVLPRLQFLVGALLKSLSSMGYVGLLLALLFYIYGVAGVHLFGRSDPEHFGSLGAALFSLFQVITLDNWTDVFRAARAGAPLAAMPFFVSFILFGTMIMLNLFIGVIINSMTEARLETEKSECERHRTESGRPTLQDEFNQAEQQLAELQKQLHVIRNRLPDP